MSFTGHLNKMATIVSDSVILSVCLSVSLSASDYSSQKVILQLLTVLLPCSIFFHLGRLWLVPSQTLRSFGTTKVKVSSAKLNHGNHQHSENKKNVPLEGDVWRNEKFHQVAPAVPNEYDAVSDFPVLCWDCSGTNCMSIEPEHKT